MVMPVVVYRSIAEDSFEEEIGIYIFHGKRFCFPTRWRVTTKDLWKAFNDPNSRHRI